jgi:hypothetical protein
MRTLALLVFVAACASPATPPAMAPAPDLTPAQDGGAWAPLPGPAPTGPLEPDRPSTGNVDAAASPCAVVEANLKRLDCRPEAFPPPGADSFATVCERTRRVTTVNVACLARAQSIDAVRKCGRAVQCHDSK